MPQGKAQYPTGIGVGFDYIDTAQVYRNQLQVGKALKESGIKGRDIWVITNWSGVAATRAGDRSEPG
ncbi:hypothetical protein DACRYDRAFT_107193 [Dacryopinax primogenitus]|uniref:NADP-dependent oxidoreductase domain-containing protein n=1 Tax=Dacryopinax primogenitus (strain DJM 731) TaxID=1858805 RepID=M5GDC7_DACPD|nr:uncharacterized protein DACRYDRAFT_107193 [Dacryopinax primogenitus]EJU02263.1 hypothetical protein DACRYDRAFT_107193 [Dacryopinax primogenitus]